MVNAPDAQLDFPAPRRVFTLMASIGSDTHGNRECSPENGQKDPPAASASQGKAGAETEFPERILVCGGGGANWCGALKSTGARVRSGVSGGIALRRGDTKKPAVIFDGGLLRHSERSLFCCSCWRSNARVPSNIQGSTWNRSGILR
jgi:hypothetical protein